MITRNCYRFLLMAFIIGIGAQNVLSKYLLVHLNEVEGRKMGNGKLYLSIYLQL